MSGDAGGGVHLLFGLNGGRVGRALVSSASLKKCRSL